MSCLPRKKCLPILENSYGRTIFGSITELLLYVCEVEGSGFFFIFLFLFFALFLQKGTSMADRPAASPQECITNGGREPAQPKRQVGGRSGFSVNRGTWRREEAGKSMAGLKH